jgi:hypothetical protein
MFNIQRREKNHSDRVAQRFTERILPLRPKAQTSAKREKAEKIINNQFSTINAQRRED